MNRAVSRPHSPEIVANVVHAVRKGVPNRYQQTPPTPAHMEAKNPRRVFASGSGFLVIGAGFCGIIRAAAAGFTAPTGAVAAWPAAGTSADRPSRAAFSISCTDGRLPTGFAAAAGALGDAALTTAVLSAAGLAPAAGAPPACVCARAAARMSFVDFGAPPGAAAGIAGAAFAARGAPAPPVPWARAAAKMSLVDFGAAAGAGTTAGASAELVACSAGASAGGVSAGPPVLPVCARAAFRISSVESFFAIFSFTRIFSETGAEGPPRANVREKAQPAARAASGEFCQPVGTLSTLKGKAGKDFP
jgi:hypothetical protein